MFFQEKFISVFLFVAIFSYLKQIESLNIQSINMTLFVFNHPSNCKRNEFYNLDYFSCSPCDPKAYLQPSFDKFTCECAIGSKIIANYDSSLQRAVCAQPCRNTKTNKCLNVTISILPKGSCNLKYINSTTEQDGVTKYIRVYPSSPNPLYDCSCDLKYNYLYGDYCIWKNLLQNYLNYNAFWQRGSIYKDLKFIAFFCQSLQNMTACNHLANLCVQSFFDADKKSPCSVFLLAQASDAALYSDMGKELHEFRPFLFYKRGKDTMREMETIFDYPNSFKRDSKSHTFDLFTTVYSLDGHLMRWGQLRPNHINLCGHNLQGLHEHFQYLKSFRIACQLTMETVIDLASMNANRQFFNVFLNLTKNETTEYMQTIPVLIESAFDENKEQNIGEWQLVKRFQLIGAQKAINTDAPQMLMYEDSFKLRLFKSIRILRKFELSCSVTEDNKISLPLITLNYHQIDISLNTSLNEIFKFELVVNFKKEQSSAILYKIGLPIFLTIGVGFAVFRSYIFKCRRNLTCCDMITVFQFVLHLMSNIGNSFLSVVVLDAFYSILSVFTRPKAMLMLPVPSVHVYEFLIYSAFGLKGFYFAVNYWKIAHIDVFFVDWERPKGYDGSLQLKNNLETSSQCSSIRALADNSVSAWRIFFVANEWIELSGKQRTSAFIQGFASLTVYWVLNSFYPLFYSDATVKLFTCVIIFTGVHIIQRIIVHLILNKVFGSPLQKFMDICTMANVSIFTLLDPSLGYYIHGRSPHGFSDTDMSSMILQLQRESQNMCGKRGLLTDSDFQTYIMLPPLNLRTQIEKLLPLKQKSDNLSQAHFHKELGSIGNNFEGTLERNMAGYNRVNRFFCAFIDHAIKDMDYIIKEKNFIENLLGCEFESFLAENKGTFYIDTGLTFSSLFLYGNPNHLFVMELLLLITLSVSTISFTTSIVIVCLSNKLFQKMFHSWVRNNVATKTLIDKRFLM